MVRLSDHRTDASAFDDGVWKVVIRDLDGDQHLRMRLRSTLYRPYQEALAMEFRQLRQKIRGDDINGVDEINARRRAAHLLVSDWEGMEDDDGKPIGFSTQMAKQIMREPDYTALYERINGIVTSLGSFEVEDAEDIKSQPA